MARQTVIVFGLVLFAALSSVQCSTEALSPNIEVNVVQNLTEYLSANPDVKILEQLITEPIARGPSSRVGITHKLGGRIRGN